MVQETIGHERSLRQQHQEWLRGVYDGHNRHSGLTSMGRLGIRRRRRRAQRQMNALRVAAG